MHGDQVKYYVLCEQNAIHIMQSSALVKAARIRRNTQKKCTVTFVMFQSWWI